MPMRSPRIRPSSPGGSSFSALSLGSAEATSAPAQWQRVVSAQLDALARAIAERIRAFGYGRQNQLAQVIARLLPADLRRGMTPSTLSRYKRPERLRHAPLEVFLAMSHTLGLDEQSVADILIAARSATTAQQMGTEPPARMEQLARSATELRLLADFRSLSSLQQEWIASELRTLASAAQVARVNLDIAHAEPPSTSEITAGLASVEAELDAWNASQQTQQLPTLHRSQLLPPDQRDQRDTPQPRGRRQRQPSAPIQ